MFDILSRCEWCTALLNQKPRGFRIFGSAHALHLPCYSGPSISGVFRDSKDSGSVGSGPGVGSDLEVKHLPERGA